MNEAQTRLNLINPAIRAAVGGRRAALQSLAGSWKDSRSTEEIIEDIERHRTKGRKVEL